MSVSVAKPVSTSDIPRIGGLLMLSCALCSCASTSTQAAPRIASNGLLLDALTSIAAQRDDGFDAIVKALRNGDRGSSNSGGPSELADGTRLSSWETYEKNGAVTRLSVTVAPSNCIALSEVVGKSYARFDFAHDGGFAIEAIGVRGVFSAQDRDRGCLKRLTLSRATPAESRSDEAERASGRIAFSRVLDLIQSSDPTDLAKASNELERARASGSTGLAEAGGDAELLRLRSHAEGGEIFGISLNLAAKPCFPIDRAVARTGARTFSRQDHAVVYEARPAGRFTTIYPNALDDACVGRLIHYRSAPKSR